VAEPFFGNQLEVGRRLKRGMIALLFLASLSRSWASSETNYPAVGIRSGFSQSGKNQTFYQSELFSTWVPAHWHLSTNWTLSPRLELTTGYLVNHGEDGFIGTLGPELVVTYQPWRTSMDTGIRATVLSRNIFEGRNFGIPFQVTSHIGIGWEFVHAWDVGYRFQHMSNSRLSSSNPGLNMHLFGVGYQF
jgi:hypothetical protein